MRNAGVAGDAPRRGASSSAGGTEQRTSKAHGAATVKDYRIVALDDREQRPFSGSPAQPPQRGVGMRRGAGPVRARSRMAYAMAAVRCELAPEQLGWSHGTVSRRSVIRSGKRSEGSSG